MSKRRVANPSLIERRLPVILDAATREFAAQGFHKVSMQDVAVAAEVSVGMIYQYVDDKQQLLYRVIDHVVAAYEHAMEAADDAGAEGLPGLCDFVFAIARVVERQRAASKLGYSEAKYLSPAQLQDIKDRERRLGAFVEARIERCIAAGQCLPCDAHRLAVHMLVTVQSWPVSAWRLATRTTAVDYAADGLATILRGLVRKDLLARAITQARDRCLASSTDETLSLEST